MSAADRHERTKPMSEFTGDLKEVADILGSDVARELRAVCGGLEIVIPETPPENGPLAALPREMLELLCSTFPRDRLYIAKGTCPRPGETLRQVLRLAEQGLTTQQIARRLGITDRRVRHHLSGRSLPTRHDPRQLSLFEADNKKTG